MENTTQHRSSPPASLLVEREDLASRKVAALPYTSVEATTAASLIDAPAEPQGVWYSEVDRRGLRMASKRIERIEKSTDALTQSVQDLTIEGGVAAVGSANTALTIDTTIKPRLLLMGMKRSGKSSISAVCFGDKTPSETLHLEPSRTVDVRNFIYYQMWDCPASMVKSIIRDPGSESAEIFDAPGSLVYIVDAQDQETHRATCADLCELVQLLLKTRPHINLEVFFHKFDSMSEDFGGEIVEDTRMYIIDELSDMQIENPPISFYNTSIYDVSMYEALSKCGQKLISRRHWALENILNSLCSKTGIEKAYLLESKTKVFIASDTSPANSKHYEACIELLDLTVDLCSIYAWREPSEGEMAEGENPPDNTSCEMWGEKGNFMGLWEMNRDLVLVCVFVTGDPGENLPIVNQNISATREGILEVLNYPLEQTSPEEE